MRLPANGDDIFSNTTKAAIGRIEAAFAGAIQLAAEKNRKRVLTGNGKTIEVESFDPERIKTLFQRLCDKLMGWNVSGPLESLTDDLGRVFCQMIKGTGKYRISGYFGIQFHILPYYSSNDRVPEIQRQLALLEERAGPLYVSMNAQADKVIEEELARRGLSHLEFEDLFTKMFEDEHLLGELGIMGADVENNFEEFQSIRRKRDLLLKELREHVTNIYQNSFTPIDYNRLMSGEEGIVTYFDIDKLSGSKKKEIEPSFDLTKISRMEGDKICSELESVALALESVSIDGR